MPQVLKWQGYREFCVNFILVIRGILNMPQVLNIQDFGCIMNLNMLQFHRVY